MLDSLEFSPIISSAPKNQMEHFDWMHFSEEIYVFMHNMHYQDSMSISIY